MAKFECVCGEIIRTSGDIPNPIEWHLISDTRFDSFEGLVDAEDVYKATTIMFRCPASDHLWVYWDGFDEPPSLYALQAASLAAAGAPAPIDDLCLVNEPLKQFDIVRVLDGVPSHGLPPGCLATILEVHAKPDLAFEIEVSDESGRTLFTGAVSASQVELHQRVDS